MICQTTTNSIPVSYTHLDVYKRQRYTRPNLSTIGQPLYDLGAISMRMLTKIMHKEELEEREVLLSHTINQRGTTKK